LGSATSDTVSEPDPSRSVFINQLPSWMKYLSPSSTAPCHFKAMGPWCLEVAEQTAPVNQYQVGVRCSRASSKRALNRNRMEVGAASLLSRLDQIFEDVMRGWSLCIIDLPSLPATRKVSTAKIGSFCPQNLSKELTHLPGSGQSLAVLVYPDIFNRTGGVPGRAELGGVGTRHRSPASVKHQFQFW